MKKIWIIFLILMLVFLTAATSMPSAEEIGWWNIGGSGGSAAVGSLEAQWVVGQGIAGIARTYPQTLCSGYLCVLSGSRTFLPMIDR